MLLLSPKERPLALCQSEPNQGVKKLFSGGGSSEIMAQEGCLLSTLLNSRRQIRYMTHLCEASNQEPRIIFCLQGSFYFLMISLNNWGAIYRENTFYPQILHALQKKVAAHFSQFLIFSELSRSRFLNWLVS